MATFRLLLFFCDILVNFEVSFVVYYGAFNVLYSISTCPNTVLTVSKMTRRFISLIFTLKTTLYIQGLSGRY